MLVGLATEIFLLARSAEHRANLRFLFRLLATSIIMTALTSRTHYRGSPCLKFLTFERQVEVLRLYDRDGCISIDVL